MKSNKYVVCSLIFVIICFQIISEAKGNKSIDCAKPKCYIFNTNNVSKGVNVGANSDVTTKTFCFPGLKESFTYIWANPVLKITREQTNGSIYFMTFYGSSVEDVEFRSQQPGAILIQRLVSSSRFFKETEDFSFNPFNLSCYLIQSDVAYKAEFKFKVADIWYMIYLIVGVIIFFSAKSWSQTVIYTTMFNYQTDICAKVISTWHGLNNTVEVLTDGLGSVKNHLYTTAGVVHEYIPASIKQSKFLAQLWKDWNMFYKEAYSWIHPKLIELSNTTLHYGSGISIGVLASVLIFFFIISRFLPSRLKSIGYILMLFGTSISMWILQTFSGYFQEPLSEKFIENWQYFAGYLAVSGLISFAVVYRYGPITDERTLNLVQWFLQGVGLVIVYNSTQIREVSIAIVLVLLGIYHFPTRLFWNQSTQNLWHRLFPPKIKLLTEDEYNKQGDVETRKELEKLREYCRSPECQTWKVISKLKSPHRFAEFIVQGAWHISYEEMTSYDNQLDEPTVTDNNDEDSELVFVLGSVSRTVRA